MDQQFGGRESQRNSSLPYIRDTSQGASAKRLNSSTKRSNKSLAQSFSQKNVSLESLEPSALKDANLIKAKQEKFQSLKNVYTMQSRIAKLQREEEKMLRKIENERKRAEELQRVRQSYDDKMRVIREASYERENKVGEIYQVNQNHKSMNRMYINEKINEICTNKRNSYDEVKKLQRHLEKEKERQKEGFQTLKMMNAHAIKQQLMESKERMKFMKEQKDQFTKVSYIQRIKEEKKDKKSTDKKVKGMEKIEMELLERVKRTQDMYNSLKPFKETSQSQIIKDARYEQAQELL